MCTVVTRFVAGEPLRILAIRDEFVGRDFDDPDPWWPAQPGAVGGRDRRAGGSWCVSDVASGVTALVLNRTERQTGTPSRGVLPLAAIDAGERWTDDVDYAGMASFNLVLAGPHGVAVWTWDTERLRRWELSEGCHLVTSHGVDSDDAKTVAFAPRFAAEPWRDVLTSCEPSDATGALVVRHPVGADVYATVFGQLITAEPGGLVVEYSRTPWVAGTWVERRWP